MVQICERHFGVYRIDERGHGEIMQSDRRELIQMSADQGDWLMAVAQRTHRTVAAVSVVVDAIAKAEMSKEHADLDRLLK